MTIGSNAFSNCQNLESITFVPGALKTIGDYAFYECNAIKNITIPYGVTEIGRYAIYCCDSLETVTIPSSVNTVGENVIASVDNLKQVNAPEELFTNFPDAFKYIPTTAVKNNLLENNATVRGKTAKVKYKKVKKKNQTIAASKLFTISPKQGAIYSKASGNKKIVINRYNGVVTVKKKLKKGTYKVKVKVLPIGNATYKAATAPKVVIIKIRVK